ncbi:hypothetical protein ACQY1Y_05045 [Microcystis ichthyoblabe FBCC-A1114]
MTTYQDVRRQVENLTPDEQLRLSKELAVTSTLTLTEVLVHPLRSGNVELAGQYRDILLDQENLIRVCCIVPQRESRSHTVGKMVVSSLSFSILSGVRS